MKFEIHFEYNDGTEDSIILEGDTIEEIRESSINELEKRGLTVEQNYMYSEELN